jgi:hypothetical protein
VSRQVWRHVLVRGNLAGAATATTYALIRE